MPACKRVDDSSQKINLLLKETEHSKTMTARFFDEKLQAVLYADYSTIYKDAELRKKF